jgi:bacterioferritin-associated ferredoxin
MDLLTELYLIEHKKQLKKTKKYELKTGQFCQLLRDKKWQQWLQVNHPTLAQDLQQHLEKGSSCGKNKEKMTEIYNKINDTGKIHDLLEFLKEEFPNIINPL